MFKKGDLICFKHDEKIWGEVVSLSDDGTCVYYKLNGCGIFYDVTNVNLVKLI